MKKIKKEKRKKSAAEKRLEKSIKAFEFSYDRAIEQLKDMGFPEPEMPSEPLNFSKIEDLPGMKSSDIGDLMVYFTRWNAYSERLEAHAGSKVALYNKRATYCRSQLMIMIPKELKAIMEAKVESHWLTKQCDRDYFQASNEYEMIKKTTRAIQRCIETVSREMTRREKL